MRQISQIFSCLFFFVALLLPLTAMPQTNCPSGWTWIDPGNDARVGDYVGAPGGSITVAYVDAATGNPVCVRLWRDADPGGKKDLDTHCAGRTLKTKGFRYSVFVHNTTKSPICAKTVGADVRPITIINEDF